jgi:hypothetical protein
VLCPPRNIWHFDNPRDRAQSPQCRLEDPHARPDHPRAVAVHCGETSAVRSIPTQVCTRGLWRSCKSETRCPLAATTRDQDNRHENEAQHNAIGASRGLPFEISHGHFSSSVVATDPIKFVSIRSRGVPELFRWLVTLVLSTLAAAFYCLARRRIGWKGRLAATTANSIEKRRRSGRDDCRRRRVIVRSARPISRARTSPRRRRSFCSKSPISDSVATIWIAVWSGRRVAWLFSP